MRSAGLNPTVGGRRPPWPRLHHVSSLGIDPVDGSGPRGGALHVCDGKEGAAMAAPPCLASTHCQIWPRGGGLHGRDGKEEASMAPLREAALQRWRQDLTPGEERDGEWQRGWHCPLRC
jgi:hypothetical protein